MLLWAGLVWVWGWGLDGKVRRFNGSICTPYDICKLEEISLFERAFNG